MVFNQIEISVMKVSVIIPVYNVSQYVRKSILSVLAQTYKDVEIVIVNDRTTDDSMEVIDDVLKTHEYSADVVIVNHPINRGLSAARNTGILNSSGRYLYFMDSDDEITSECIELLVNSAQQCDSDIVVGDYEVRNSDIPFPPLELKETFIDGKEQVLKVFMEKKVYQMAWNKLIKRELVIRKHLFFKEGLVHEDCLWSFLCACNADSLSVVDEKTYLYNVRSNSIMTGVSLEKDFKAYLIVLDSIIQLSEEYKLLKNRLVYSYIEEEKFYLDYAYCKKERIPDELLDEYFGLIYKQPYSLWCIFIWGLLHKKYRIRDAHYFLPEDMRREYYLRLPDYKWRYSEKIVMKVFRRWFVKVLVHKLTGCKWLDYNNFEI